jgi:hypothetical protein
MPLPNTPGVVPGAVVQTAPAGVSSAPMTTSPYTEAPAAGAMGSGMCLQFGPGGVCVRSQ